MKVKEILKEESKIKEIKKVEEENEDDEDDEDLDELVDIITPTVQTQVDFETNRENGMLASEEAKTETQNVSEPNFTLEDVVGSEPSAAFSEKEDEKSGDFYRTAHDDFYSNDSDIYAGTAKSKSGDAYMAGNDERGNFYNRSGENHESVGEIRGERRSGLELGGSQVGKRDRRSEEDKYKSKSY